MAYQVSLTRRAERDLDLLFESVAAQHIDAAFKWYRGLKEAILSLGNNPQRCPITPDDKRLRHLLYGRKPHVYRVIYRVSQRRKIVEIVHIRHGARDRLGPRRTALH